MANPQPSDTRTNSVQLRQKAERRYYRLLNRLFRRAEQEIVGLEDPEKIIRALNHLSESRLFIEWAREAARQMATILAVDQKATWRLAAKASSQGRMIYKALLKETTKTAIGQTIQDIVVEKSSTRYARMYYDEGRQALTADNTTKYQQLREVG